MRQPKHKDCRRNDFIDHARHRQNSEVRKGLQLNAYTDSCFPVTCVASPPSELALKRPGERVERLFNAKRPGLANQIVKEQWSATTHHSAGSDRLTAFDVVSSFIMVIVRQTAQLWVQFRVTCSRVCSHDIQSQTSAS
jgi:hypothetical protein